MDGNGVDRVDVSDLKSCCSILLKKRISGRIKTISFLNLDVDTKAANAVITSSFDKKQRDDSRFSLFLEPGDDDIHSRSH